MSIRAIISRIRSLGQQAAIDEELAAEIDEHLRLVAEAKIAAGVVPSMAYEAARREFGNVTLARQSSREEWGWPALDAFIADVRFGARVLRKHWASTLVATGALGIGIGVTTAVVSILESVRHPPYAVADVSRLAILWAKSTRTDYLDEMQISMPELRLWQRDVTQAAIGGYTWSQSANVSTAAEPVRTVAALVTSNLLSVFGVTPALGRGFTDADAADDAPNTAIITYDFWQEQLGGNGAALTRPLIIDRAPYAIIGVLPRQFKMPMITPVKILLPLRRAPRLSDPSARSIIAVGRLSPTATFSSLARELEPISRRFNDEQPATRGAWAVNVEPLELLGRHDVARRLDIVLGLAVGVLLIACANVAILLLARLPARRQELTIRLALGAGGRRLVCQLVVESALLALGAAAVGLGVAQPAMSVLLRLIGPMLPFELSRSLDGHVIVAAVLLAVATCFLFGLAPALSAVRSLRLGGTLIVTRGAGARDQEWLRAALMTAEVALSVVLLVGGSLMIESLLAVNRRPLGFEPRELVTARVLLDTTRYHTVAAQQTFFTSLADRLRAHRELRDVTVASQIPLGTAGDLANNVTADAEGVGRKPDTLVAGSRVVMPDYFTALHVPIVNGRMFDGHEREPVVVVNEDLAHRFWPGESAIGKRVRILSPMYNDGEVVAPSERRVVAVVRNIRPSPTHPMDSWPNVFVPYGQNALRGMYIAVRAPSPAGGAQAIRQEVAALDPLLPVYGVKSIGELLDYWLSGPNLNAVIVDVLAAIGTLLTLIGIYSVVAVFVSQRTHEIGIRSALGAQRRDIVRMVLGQTLRPAVLGVGVGAVAAFVGSGAIRSMLNGVSPLEPRAFVTSVVLLVIVVLLAALVPARVAARLDPLTALRTD